MREDITNYTKYVCHLLAAVRGDADNLLAAAKVLINLRDHVPKTFQHILLTARDQLSSIHPANLADE